jgi:methionine-S-sulfoxide reductase
MPTETIFLAGGCFWGVQDLMRAIPGVVETAVGYMGGALENPTYEHIKMGNTGHAETVRIVYDPAQISLTDLLVQHFFRLHDPTTLNRQGNDRGTQYRSAIFCSTPAQQDEAREAITAVEASGFWSKPVTTTVELNEAFWLAESYHQDYLVKQPNGYTCHFYR